MQNVHGVHIISDMKNCNTNFNNYINEKKIEQYILQKIEVSGLTPVESLFHSFGENQGFTGMVILAESHVSIHTWPEERMVCVDVYCCNVTQDNSAKAQYVYEKIRALFNPETENFQFINR